MDPTKENTAISSLAPTAPRTAQAPHSLAHFPCPRHTVRPRAPSRSPDTASHGGFPHEMSLTLACLENSYSCGKAQL